MTDPDPLLEGVIEARSLRRKYLEAREKEERARAANITAQITLRRTQTLLTTAANETVLFAKAYTDAKEKVRTMLDEEIRKDVDG